MRGEKRGQIWIETVIYTLIAFVMIGIVLSFVKPKLEEVQDKAIIEQSLVIMKEIDGIISEVANTGPGNKRLIEVGIKKGLLKFDGEGDTISFEIESQYAYSQAGEPFDEGGITVVTQTRGNYNLVSLTNNYTEEHNITYSGEDVSRTLTQAPTSYTLSITNMGIEGTKTIIDINFN